MISLGNLLWIIALGAFLFFMMKKGGGCCGGGQDGSQGINKKEQNHLRHGKEQGRPKGGCCG